MKSKSPENKTVQAFDCKVGDIVVDRRGSSQPQQGTIIRVGLRNEFGYNLDIRVKWANGKTEKTNPFNSNIRILPPASEVPALETFAKKHRLIVVRNPGRSRWAYYLTDAAYEPVYLRIVEVQSAGLYFEERNGALATCEGKPSMEDSRVTVVAGKRRLSQETLLRSIPAANSFLTI
jgi:hypothetical protein